MGHDEHTRAAHVLVPARVVEVPMGVENEPDRLVADGGNGRHYLRRQRSELVIDEEHRVPTDGDANVAAGAREHVNAVC